MNGASELKGETFLSGGAALPASRIVRRENGATKIARIVAVSHHRHGRRIVSLLAVFTLLSASLQGCSSRSFRSEITDTHQGRHLSIAIVPMISEPEFKIIVTGTQKPGAFKLDKTGTYAGKGAGGGAYVGLRLSFICGPFVFACAPFFAAFGGVVGGVGGAVTGLVSDINAAPSARDAVSGADRSAGEAVQARKQAFQGLVAANIVAAGSSLTSHSLKAYPGVRPPDWGRTYSGADIQAKPKEPIHADLRGTADLVLEVRVPLIGVIYDQGTDDYMIFFDAETRMIRPGHSNAVSGTSHRYLVPSDRSARSAAAWSDKLPVAAEALGTAIAESVFLDSERLPLDRTWDKRHCVLEPLLPVTLNGPQVEGDGSSEITVMSLSPTLVWEAFPRNREGVTESEASAEKIGKVTYDLRVWKRKDDGSPADLVYEKMGLQARTGSRNTMLTEIHPDEVTGKDKAWPRTINNIRTAEHMMDVRLEPATDYLWSVRARYTGKDGDGVTTWSRYLMKQYPRDSCDANIIAPAAFYRFRTAAADAK